ncbi:hypothetical protein FIM08_02490 [SAR202 cluster bacterium AC-647-N09_OGT_505m]|nr:hypothetical protein [SAR202 cluster bacterium AC-647-N09_OGT_505m]
MKLKSISLILLLPALMLLLAACGGESEMADRSTSLPTATYTGVPPRGISETTPAPIDTSAATPVSRVTVTGPGEHVVPRTDSSGANWNHLSAAENYRRVSPPDAKAIDLEYDDIVGKVRVIGNPGAVPEESNVMVANLELGGVTLVVADSSGAFEASVLARPGTHVLVKQDTTGQQINLSNGVDEQLINEGPKSPGVILSIPAPETKEVYGFAGGARIPNKETVWVVEGSLSRIAFQDGDRATIDGKLSILTGTQIIDDQILGDIRYNFIGRIIGDENGLPVGPGGTFASNILTPTGLPILTGMNNGDFFNSNCDGSPLNWRDEKDKSVSDFSCDVNIDTYGGTPEGTYILWLALHFPEDTPNVNEDGKLFSLGTSVAGTRNMVALATVTVGSPKPVRLPTTLFADLLQEGTRGGVWSRENESEFDIGPLTITNHNPVIPRLDPYDDSLSHRLDPYAPLLGMVDRITPAVPFIEFDFSSSKLQIIVERPDGKTDVLGPAPLGAYGVRTPILPGNRPIAGGGGHIVEIPQLLGLGDEFVYEFPLDGDYILKLSGHINDINGYMFELTGTYDLTVASSLDIETMLLPGTPFEAGDSLPVGLHVYPRVPAEVDFTVTHVGADNNLTLQQYKGVANESGYWDGGGEYYTFENAGEYKIDVEARYTSKDSALWVGRLVYGSAIATPDGPIIAHGRRGTDGTDSIPPPWGFGSDFEPGGHHQFPFFTGDILWGVEGPEPNREEEMGPGDSVNTQLSFQALDTKHPLVARAIKQVPPNSVGGDISSFVKAGQIPLATFVELNPDGSDKGLSLGFRPEQLNLRAYSYTSAQRPGVRVRELIQGNDVGIAYWRFNDAYHMQSGNGHEGDLPGDFKFLYGAAVIRDIELKEGIFAIYGSSWVLARDDDPMGSRFMPPFQGNAGGPNGGPLFNVHGRDVDMFFLPLGVRPGSVLGVGDIFRMAGPIMPTLPSKVEYTVTAPDGAKRTLEGRANAVGYYYDPSNDFELDQPGLWTVELTVTHDGMTSAGPVQEPYPTGGPLTPDGLTFTFVVTDNGTKALGLTTDLIQRSPLLWYSGGIQNAHFETTMPQGWTGKTAHVTVAMPGIVLVEKDIRIEGGVTKWWLKGEEMNLLANNFDYGAGLSDTITVTYYAEELSGRQAAGTIVTHGARVPLGLPYPVSGDWPTGQTRCIQGETELFASDFEKGTEGWRFSSDEAWSVVQADDSNVLRGAGHVHAYAGDNWDEVAWRMRVKLITGNAHLNFHDKDGLRYLISFGQNDTNVMWRDVGVGSNIHHSLNKWHVVEISLFEKVLRIGIDGVLEIEQPDSNPLPPGGIWLEVLPDSEVLFDDIHICEPNG